MKNNPGERHPRSIRLKGFDYSQPGAYFVTICTRNKVCVFGEVVDGEMRLNIAGQMIQEEWLKIGVLFPTIQMDEFVVMPNHFHAIINIVGAFKSITTHAYILGVRSGKWPEFDRCLWQRNYYEHIIRDQTGWRQIQDYIRANPLIWDNDRLKPGGVSG